MTRFISLCLSIAISLSSMAYIKSDARAANIGDILGDVIGGAVQNANRNKQKRQRQKQYNAQQRKIQQEENKRLVAHFKRVQTALKSLGFYTSKIDGDFGPGSKASYSKYISAFELSYVDPEAIDIAMLEQHARAGWRSADELRQAERGGFFERSEYLNAKNSGFTDRTTWINAKDKGFSDHTQYTEFLNSGFENVEDYRADIQAKLIAKQHVEACLKNVESKKWLEAERSCAFAKITVPNDLAISSSHKRAVSEVDRIIGNAYDERQAALDIIQPSEGAGDDQTNEQDADLGDAQKSLKAANLLIAEVELRRGESNCEALITKEAYQQTLDECDKIYQEHANLAFTNPNILASQNKLKEIIKNAQSAIAENNEKTEAEQEKLALQKAKDAASGLIESVSTFIGSGGGFDQPLAIAQALTNLRRASTSLDTQIIVANNLALAKLVETDEDYITFSKNREIADQTAKNAALIQTRYNVEKMDVFIEQFVTKNLLDDRVGVLLQLKQSLSQVLSSGNEDQIKSANLNVANKLDVLNLTDQLSAFEYTPDGVVVSKEDVVASKASLELEKSALKKSKVQANQLLQNIQKFADSNGKFQEPITVATSVASLRKALKINELSDIELRVSELSETLNQDSNFLVFTKSLDVATNASLANAASLAREGLHISESFLVNHINNNITSENIDQFIQQKDEISQALQSGTDERVVSVENDFIAFIEAKNLKISFDDFKQSATHKNVSVDIKTAQNGLALNPVNAYLLDGHAKDLIVLANSSQSAPHIGKNLLGTTTFTDGKANLCWAHAVPKPNTSVRLTINKIRNSGATTISQEICSDENLLNYDLIAINRDSFLQGSASLANLVVTAFEEDKLAEFIKTSKNEIETFNARNETDGQLLANEILASLKDGYGIVQIANDNNTLCVTPSENQNVHKQLIDDNSEFLNILLLGDFEIESHSLDQAYLFSQRGKCGSIYASEKDLQTLLTALHRENQDYSVIPKWFLNSEFSETKAFLVSLADASEQELARKAQEREAELMLVKAKQDEVEEKRLYEQALLRNKHVKDAMDFFKPLGKSIKEHILQESQSNDMALFVNLENNITGLRNDLWKFTDVDYSLVDYGNADWQGREVTALVARFFYKSKNEALGQIRTDCALVGYLIDAEFDKNRDPIYASCDQEAEVKNWLNSRKFSSLWNVE